MLIVGVDTGLRACGLGVADVDTGRIIHGSLVKNPCDSEEPSEVWLAMARAVGFRLAEVSRAHGHAFVRLLVVERQYVPKTHPNPNQLVGLMCVVGALFASIPADETRVVFPSNWKASEGKDRKNRGTWAHLTEEERATVKGTELKTTGHNVLDAVGIARWGLRKVDEDGSESDAAVSDYRAAV